MMTTAPSVETPTPSEELRKEPSLESLVGRLVVSVTKELSPGDRADLRRVSPDDFGGPAFWKIAASHLVPAGAIAADGPLRERQERAWLAILSAIAKLEELHDPRHGLGAALGQAGFSELRFTRLLRAEGDALLDQVRTMVGFLASKGASANVADIARLILSDSHSNNTRVRRNIARGYYSHSRD